MLAGVSITDEPAMTSTPGAHPNDAPVAHALAAAFSSRHVEEALAALKTADVPAVRANAGDSEIFLGDPQALENGLVAERQHPKAGHITVAWQYIRFGETLPSQGRPTPLLGEHTEEILGDIGYTKAEIDALHMTRVVKSERA